MPGAFYGRRGEQHFSPDGIYGDETVGAVEAFHVDCVPLLIGEGESPSLIWDVDSDDVWLNGERLAVTGAFLRRDVFHGGGRDADYRAASWHATLQGWLAASPRIRLLNRACLEWMRSLIVSWRDSGP